MRSVYYPQPPAISRIPPRNTPVPSRLLYLASRFLGPYARFMKTLPQVVLIRIAFCVCSLLSLTIALPAEPITIAMTADHWQVKENAEFLRQLGFFHGLMRLNSGDALLKGLT